MGIQVGTKAQIEDETQAKPAQPLPRGLDSSNAFLWALGRDYLAGCSYLALKAKGNHRVVEPL